MGVLKVLSILKPKKQSSEIEPVVSVASSRTNNAFVFVVLLLAVVYYFKNKK